MNANQNLADFLTWAADADRLVAGLPDLPPALSAHTRWTANYLTVLAEVVRAHQDGTRVPMACADCGNTLDVFSIRNALAGNPVRCFDCQDERDDQSLAVASFAD